MNAPVASTSTHRALGLPHTMQAHTIRPERYGPPLKAFALERVPLPPVGGDECLVKVMAAGVNHNGIWAAQGHPVDVVALQGGGVDSSRDFISRDRTHPGSSSPSGRT